MKAALQNWEVAGDIWDNINIWDIYFLPNSFNFWKRTSREHQPWTLKTFWNSRGSFTDLVSLLAPLLQSKNQITVCSNYPFLYVIPGWFLANSQTAESTIVSLSFTMVLLAIWIKITVPSEPSGFSQCANASSKKYRNNRRVERD